MKIVFMGTSEFAVPILKALIDSHKHQIVAVYTAPPKNAGRHMHVTKSPVHQLAEENKLPVFTPSTFKIQNNVEEFCSLKHDITVVAAYGLILKKTILEAAKYGAINVHPSTLPRWRGAAPIQRSIMAGDKTTSVCIMQMDEGLDTGDILLQNDIVIPINANAADLSQITSLIGGKMVLEVIDLLQNGLAKRVKQSAEGITYANKIEKEEGQINWNESAEKIHSQIRGLEPNPGAFFIHENALLGKKILIKIKNAILGDISCNYTKTHNLKPGEFVKYKNADNKIKVGIVCGDGSLLAPITVQKEGAKAMDWEAFLSGYKADIKVL